MHACVRACVRRVIDHRDYRHGGRITDDEASVFPSGAVNRVEIKINDAVWGCCVIIFAIRKMHHRDILLKSIKTYASCVNINYYTSDYNEP